MVWLFLSFDRDDGGSLLIGKLKIPTERAHPAADLVSTSARSKVERAQRGVAFPAPALPPDRKPGSYDIRAVKACMYSKIARHSMILDDAPFFSFFCAKSRKSR